MGPSVTDLHPLPVPPDMPFAAEPDAVVILVHERPGAHDRLPTATPTCPTLSNGAGCFLCKGQSVEFCVDFTVRKPFDQGHGYDRRSEACRCLAGPSWAPVGDVGTGRSLAAAIHCVAHSPTISLRTCTDDHVPRRISDSTRDS